MFWPSFAGAIRRARSTARRASGNGLGARMTHRGR
jgi:hypothetical protein